MARWVRGFVGRVASVGVSGWRGRWGVRGLTCAVLSLSVLTSLVGGAGARGLGPRRAGAARAASDSGLVRVDPDALSCSSPRACTVLGQEPSNGLQVLQRWDGRSWSTQQVPFVLGSELVSLSCPSTHMCFAVGSRETLTSTVALVERWTGGSWRVVPTPSLTGADLGDVSCSSSSACLAIGGSDNTALVERWNGTSWSVQPSPAGGLGIGLVSCPSSSGCIAVGGLDEFGVGAARWNGVLWLPESVPSSPGRETFINDLSCSSLTACVADGGWESGECASEGILEGAAWPGFAGVAARDCAGNLTWTLRGSRWSVRNTSALLSSPSCVSANWCMAAGYRPYLWNGKRWSILSVPRHAQPSYVSCTSVRACIGVSDGGESSWRWNGRRWRRIPGLPRAPA